MTFRRIRAVCARVALAFSFALSLLTLVTPARALPLAPPPPAEVYQYLVAASRGAPAEGVTLPELTRAAAAVDWEEGARGSFEGHLRVARGEAGQVYFLRAASGALFLLALPEDPSALAPGSSSPYAGLDELVKYKLALDVHVSHAEVGNVRLVVAQLAAPPARLAADRLFFTGIIVLLFLVMVGMGLTLTPQSFKLVMTRPRGMIVGPICQFGILPLLAFALGRAAGFHETHPFIFLGLLLVATSPGGVTSNLMTYFARGDVALSVSMTAFSTALSPLLTPVLLGAYAAGLPDVNVPVGDVFKQVLILVAAPLAVGMLLRARAPRFAARSEKFFSILGVAALLVLVVAGVLGNVDKFSDTRLYGLKFYAILFVLTGTAMLAGALLSKLFRLDNRQARAVSLETGLQNASLAMTLALLLQDRMGDYDSAMFFTSGIFGIWMYPAGALMLLVFRKLLPVDAPEKSAAPAPVEAG